MFEFKGLTFKVFMVVCGSLFFQTSWGRKQDMTKIIMPTTSTPIVFLEQPSHSLRMMPQRLENTTLRAISMQNERVISVGDSMR